MDNIYSFSINSDQYARYRPLYPPELIKYLAGLVPPAATVWDCATGNGQAAALSTVYFNQIIASDISLAQLHQAHRHPSIIYCVTSAENPAFSNINFDLIMVAQALHWFNLEHFYTAVHRLLNPGGFLAVWGYDFFKIDSNIDVLFDACLLKKIDPFWSAGNRILQAAYRPIPFPFDEISNLPVFEISLDWNLTQLLAYLSTWSAVKRYQAETGKDPLEQVKAEVKSVWPEAEVKRVTMPIFMRVGKQR
ncbi:MAG: class I SAM-dependent methyltransferase [Anaerolineae bacterium]|nr:class I SAM-dependent methyltransferase [Anaerolineae bacterium]